MKTQTWLPLFNGFYGTILEPDEMNELDYIEQQRAENNLPPLKNLFDLCDFDYDSYHKGVAKYCTNYVENILVKLGVVRSIKFESINSPKEYNFYNDSINIEVDMSLENQKRIVSLIEQYSDEWRQYLQDRHTSRSGFIPSYSNDPEDWNIKECLQHSHQCGSILQFMVFCYANEEGEEYDRLYENMHEYATCNNSLETKNYEELTEKEYCPECNQFVDPDDFNGNCCYDCEEISHKNLHQLRCAMCTDPIENHWYHRSLKHRVLIGDLKIDNVMCSDCALKYNNLSVLN